jgi:hypothetical protein
MMIRRQNLWMRMQAAKFTRAIPWICALCALLFASSLAHAGDAYQWTQFTAQGLEARAITEQSVCPKAMIDGRDVAMTVRAAPNDSFPILLCALTLPQGVKEATINGRPLPLPPPRIDKILLIGDTGCRVIGLVQQNCNSLPAWPFRLVADLAAERAPDLVLHLGDLIYREKACPASRAGCAGSPFGDRWETWKADFFDPAEALLWSTPWLFVRGNHEICERAGAGWSRLTAAFPYDGAKSCAPQEAPFTVDLGGLSLAVLDVTRAEDRSVDASLAPLFREQFAGLAKIDGPVWLTQHKPIFSLLRMKDGAPIGDNKTLAEAARGAMPGNVTALLAAHLHIFEAASYVEDYPAHIVAGNGGDLMEASPPERFDGLAIGGVTVDVGRSGPQLHGYAMLERGAEEWLLTDYDTHGKALLRCHIRGRKIACD